MELFRVELGTASGKITTEKFIEAQSLEAAMKIAEDRCNLSKSFAELTGSKRQPLKAWSCYYADEN